MLLCSFLALSPPAQGQAPAQRGRNRVLTGARHTVSGYVRDSLTNEALPGLTVTVVGKTWGTTSNAYGFYSITLPADSAFTLAYSYLGYVTQRRSVRLTADRTLDIRLVEEGMQLSEVVISGDKPTDPVEQTQMGLTRLSAAQIKKVPAIFGEIDLLKVLQFLPGIKGGTEATAGFYVRGGGSDQNLILLDEAIVYNAAHLGGLFSVFNPDAVKGLEVYKGNFPAKFGGRLSSVLDVQLREGNQNKFGGAFGLGLISSRLTLEGPIQKGKSSWIVSGRRTYLDIFTRVVNEANRDNPDFNPIPDYYFYDFNVKANYQLGPRDRLYLSGYFGRDVFGFTNQNFNFNFTWGNITTSLRWNHLFNDRLFVNTTAIYTEYEYSINNNFGAFRSALFSRIQDATLKVDFDWYPSPRHNVKFGALYIGHTFTPSGLDTDNSQINSAFQFTQRLVGSEGALYVSDDYDLNPWLRINVGLRLAGYASAVVAYGGLEPRAAARFRLSENVALKTSYAHMRQYVHLATSSTASLPTDVWYPSTQRLRPQYADIVSAGVTWVMPKMGLTFTSELYYKWLENQVELREGARLFANPQLDQEFTLGRGRSYGAEFLLERKEGKTTGWISYTWSWTDRTFPELNGGRTFPFRFDRRHDLSLVISREITPRLSASATFVYRTGEAVTPNSVLFSLSDYVGGTQSGAVMNRDGGFSIIPGNPVPVFGERNSYRMPDYHRADVSITWRFKPKRGESELVLSAYNVYNRRNPFFFYGEVRENPDGGFVETAAEQVALFPIIPSITWNRRF